MSDQDADTIAAIATAAGEAALSVIRLSGPQAGSIVGKLLGLEPSEPEAQAAQAAVAKKLPPRMAMLCTLRDEAGEVLDSALVTRFAAPASFTGEEVVEISAHGGVVVTRALFEALLRAGARPATGGEFTQRAFLNGKLDLTQAEAVMDLISARTEQARQAASQQLEGRLGAQVMEMRQHLLHTLAHVEAWIDFPDEDIDPASVEQLRVELASLDSALSELLDTSWQGRLLREGARVVLCGRPNAGKSSILNLLSGFERAIVSEQQGTTRDTLEEWIELGGVPVCVVDTAGLREDSDDALEQEGMRRTRAEWAKADLVLEILDGSEAGKLHPELQTAKQERGLRHLAILNKRDLGEHEAWAQLEGLRFSAQADEPQQLAEAIVAALDMGASVKSSNFVAINARHQQLLSQCQQSLQASLSGLEQGLEPDFVALDLREAMQALGEVVGRVDVEEVLGEIFATFCIGK